ncbi:MAG: AGE family epimerase/isomerase [Candidatus Marinimicrobia bacterium]|nr:AGE family epimerase/isomerase [Candidatus Neomarinimicrobiota bacterium]
METKIIDYLEKRLAKELYDNILPFWIDNAVDYDHGGFIGRIFNDLRVEENAPKGLILNARILWTFSKAYNISKIDDYLQIATRAYRYLIEKFYDEKFGGFVWSVDYNGNFFDEKKRAYGQGFAIYGLSEYYRASRDEWALKVAIDTFHHLEKYAFDPENTGYFETYNRDWTLADDLRLSERDMDEKKSMNNHLHLLEGYANLYRVWKNKLLEKQLRSLLLNFRDHIINRETLHFRLFFDEKWHPKSANESYGHDIEGSWLLFESAEILGHDDLIDDIKHLAVKMAEVSRDNHLSPDGSLCFESSPGTLNREKHWWVSAEALVGYFNAYELTGEKAYLYAVQKVWDFIDHHFVDKELGEWYYLINESGHVDNSEYKVSEWKGPYHNGRACIEILARIRKIKHGK